MTNLTSIDTLQLALGYTFQDSHLLTTALSHRSLSGSEHNERLEFLGDSVLSCVIAEALYTHYPEENEGKLTQMRAIMVRREALVALAQQFRLGDYIQVGSGELKNGGQYRDSTLANAMEAIIGAVYLDAQFEVCRKLVLKWYQDSIVTAAQSHIKDAKTLLQEYCQAKSWPLPSYRVVSVSGKAHHQTFHITCCIRNQEFIGEGSGSNRQKAEKIAAQHFLAHLRAVELNNE